MTSLALFLLTAQAVVPAANTPAADRLTERALQARVAAMSTDERIRWGEVTLKQQPSRTFVRLELASAFLQKYRETADGGYLDRAAQLLDAEKTAPHHPGIARRRLELAMIRHEFPQVAQQAEAWLADHPGDFAVWALYGDALLELGRYAEAGSAFERLIGLRANQESYNRIAYQRFLTGRGAEALGWMRLAVEAGAATPEHQAWCLTEYADLLDKLGQPEEARRQVSRAVTLFPNAHRAHALLARLDSAQPKAAMGHWNRALGIVPLPEYAAGLALAHERAGDAKAAAAAWRTAETVEQLARARGEAANRQLALAYADAGRSLERALALVEAERAVRDDVYTHDARAWVLFRLGRVDEARAAMEKALAWNTPDPLLATHARAIRGAAPAAVTSATAR